MPIVVAVLGVVIIVLGVLFFTLSPAETTNPAIENVEVNRTETMEVESETEINVNPIQTPETSSEDNAASLAATYTGSGTYLTPARTSHKLDVTLTVENGIVTDASVVYDEGAGYSNPNQERFDKAYKTEVIGKPLAEISLSRVGGASVTTNAFNEAVTSIKSQIQS